MKYPAPKSVVIAIAVVTVCWSTRLTLAQTPTEVRQAFVDLHDDLKKNNCGDAVDWLYARRDALKEDLLEELYQTDAQGASAIMFLLFNVRSFDPDERFINTVMNALSIDDRYYVGGKFGCGFASPEPGQITGTWQYIDAHFDIFEPRLTQLVATTSDPWVLWAIAWEFKSRNLLEKKIDLFTPEVMKKAAAKLADDKIGWNASQTVRLFLILGDRTVPILQGAAKSSDRQANNLARAVLDALKGNRRAFGYLNSKLNLTYELLDLPGAKRSESPEWLSEESEPYVYNDKPYP